MVTLPESEMPSEVQLVKDMKGDGTFDELRKKYMEILDATPEFKGE